MYLIFLLWSTAMEIKQNVTLRPSFGVPRPQRTLTLAWQRRLTWPSPLLMSQRPVGDGDEITKSRAETPVFSARREFPVKLSFFKNSPNKNPPRNGKETIFQRQQLAALNGSPWITEEWQKLQLSMKISVPIPHTVAQFRVFYFSA